MTGTQKSRERPAVVSGVGLVLTAPVSLSGYRDRAVEVAAAMPDRLRSLRGRTGPSIVVWPGAGRCCRGTLPGDWRTMLGNWLILRAVRHDLLVGDERSTDMPGDGP